MKLWRRMKYEQNSQFCCDMAERRCIVSCDGDRFMCMLLSQANKEQNSLIETFVYISSQIFHMCSRPELFIDIRNRR